MAEMDSLSIEISASADAASRSLNDLVAKLDVLSGRLASISGSGLSGFASSIQEISTAMQGLRGVTLPDYTRLATGISRLANVDPDQIRRAGDAIGQLGNSLASLDRVNISDNIAPIADLAKAIAQLGYKSAQNAATNIPRLATAMSDLMNTLSRVPRVSQNLIDMTNALANLARTGASSGRAADSLSRSLNTYTTATGKAKKGTTGLASALGKMYATYWLVFRAVGKLGEAIDISSSLTEVQNVVDVTFGDMAYKVEEFAQTSIQQLGMSELMVKETASTFQAMGSAMNIDTSSIEKANAYLNQQTGGYVGLSDSLSDVSLNLTKLTADMASFYNMEQKDVAEDLQAIFTGMVQPLMLAA